MGVMGTSSDRPQRYTFDRVVRLVISGALLVGLIALLRHLSDVLIPFVVAVVLAYLLNPLVEVYQRKVKRRGLAVALTLLTVGLAGVAVASALVPLMVSQVDRFTRDIELLQEDLAAGFSGRAASVTPAPAAVTPAEVVPAGAGSAEPGDAAQGPAPTETRAPEPGAGRSELGWDELWAGWKEYQAAGPDTSREARFALLKQKVEGTYIGDAIDQVPAFLASEEFNQWVMSLVQRVAAGGWTVLTILADTLIGLTVLIIVVIYLVFLLLDFPHYAHAWRESLPPGYREPVLEFTEEFEFVLGRYLRGQALVALLMGILFSIGFTIVGMPMAVPLGLFIGMLNMVPYLQTVGLVPATLLAVMRSVETGSSLVWSLFLMLAVFGVAQLIQDAFINPRVMGKVTGLRPIAILLGVFIWGKLLGFLGLLLAIPLTCMAIAYYRRFVLQHPAAETKLNPQGRGNAGDVGGATSATGNQ